MRSFKVDVHRLWLLDSGSAWLHGYLAIDRYSPWDWKHYSLEVVMTFAARPMFWKRLHIEFTRWVSPFRHPWCFRIYFER